MKNTAQVDLSSVLVTIPIECVAYTDVGSEYFMNESKESYDEKSDMIEEE